MPCPLGQSVIPCQSQIFRALKSHAGWILEIIQVQFGSSIQHMSGWQSGIGIWFVTHRWLVLWVWFQLEATIFCWFWDPMISILCKNTRNVRFVLFKKNSNKTVLIWDYTITGSSFVVKLLWEVKSQIQLLKTSLTLWNIKKYSNSIRCKLSKEKFTKYSDHINPNMNVKTELIRIFRQKVSNGWYICHKSSKIWAAFQG